MVRRRIGGFISADTIVPDFRNPQALNRYSYCYNNPLKYTDPTGHGKEDLPDPSEDGQLGWSEGQWYISQGGEWVPINSPDDRVPIEDDSSGESYSSDGLSLEKGSTVVCPPTQIIGQFVGELGWFGYIVGIVVLCLSIPTESPRDNIIQSKNGTDTIQTGGQGLNDRTAKELNEYKGEDLAPREWGRALEELKHDKHIPNNDHGKKKDVSYQDNQGNY